MTGVTTAQVAILDRIMEAAADDTIEVVGYFEGMPSGYSIRQPVRTDGVLEFQTPNDLTVRVREDLILGITEAESFDV